jgi:hypothetical protein
MRYTVKSNIYHQENSFTSIDACAKYIQKRILSLTENKIPVSIILFKISEGIPIRYVCSTLFDNITVVFTVEKLNQKGRNQIHSPN